MSDPTSKKPTSIDVDVEHAESKSDTPEDLHSKNIQQADDLNLDIIRKVIRKVDLRLMPGLGLLYTVSLIDRVNLSVVSRSFSRITITQRAVTDEVTRRESLEWTQI